MRYITRVLGCLVIVWLSSTLTLSYGQQLPPPLSNTLQSAQAGNANGTVQTVTGYGTIGLLITPASSWNGTANFEASVDGSGYGAVTCTNVSTLAKASTYASTTTAAQFSCPVAGMKTFRARTSGASAGSVTIKSLATFAGGGGGSGGSGVLVEEISGAHAGFAVKLKVSNTALTDNGDGSFTLITGAGGGGDFSSNTSTSVDNEVVLFSGTGGKIGKRASLTTDVVKSTSGVLGAAAYTNVVALWPGCTGFLKNDGTCASAGTGDALTTNPLSQFAATTSAQLYGVISDETGSASGTPLLVFNQSPTIVTPTIASFANAGHSHADAAGGGQLSNTAVAAANLQGNGTKFQLFAGSAPSTNDCAKFDANGNVASAGASCFGLPADPNANKLLAWDDTDNAIGYWALGSGFSYDHASHTVSVSAGGGNVSNSGTPTSGQIAEWTSATQIQGVAVSGSGNVVRASGPKITNFWHTNKVLSQSDTSPIAIDSDTYNEVHIAELSQATTFSAPTGTPSDSQLLVFYIYTTLARSLTWNAAFSGTNFLPLPSTTVAATHHIYIFRYSSLTSTWDLVGAIPATAPLAVTYGGTGADMSATGGTGYVVKQTTAGGAFSASTLASTDLSDTTAIVRNNAGNTYSTGAQDFGSATSLKVPTSADAGPTASGLIAYDSTADTYKGGANTAGRSFVLGFGSDTQNGDFTVTATYFMLYRTIGHTSANPQTFTLPGAGALPPDGQSVQIVNYGAGTLTITTTANMNGSGSDIVLAGGAFDDPSTAWVISSGGSNYNVLVRQSKVSILAAAPAVTGDVAVATGGGAATLATKFKTGMKSITIDAPVTGDSNKAQWYFPSAVTITRVACSISGTTSITIQLDERAEATPNTAGTDVLTSALVCDADSQTTTSFSNATIAARVPLNLQITAASGTPTSLRVHVEYTID